MNLRALCLLKPCPLCPGSDKTPLVYRGRHSGRFLFRPGVKGCRHMVTLMEELAAFSDSTETEAELVTNWNQWVDSQTPQPISPRPEGGFPACANDADADGRPAGGEDSLKAEG